MPVKHFTFDYHTLGYYDHFIGHYERPKEDLGGPKT